MPKRQETFKLVPATLVNSTTPRRPMTSKEAKKAYREASKVPKLSRAEQRRIEAEEIAQQKKEYERERAAAKASAAREKKLKKQVEEKEKRKRLGIPEPNRYVRPSQPTIKGFVRSRACSKRTWEEMDGMVEEGTDTGDEILERGDINRKDEPPPQKINVLRGTDDDDDFGVFPSLSQVDMHDFSSIANIYQHTVDATTSGTNNLQNVAQVQQRGLSSTFPATSCRSQGMKPRRKDALYHEEGPHMRKLKLSQQDDEDEFGDFPSLSQIDVHSFDIANNDRPRRECPNGEIPMTIHKSLTGAVEREVEIQKDATIDETVKLDCPADKDKDMICKELEEKGTQEKTAQNALGSGQGALSVKSKILATTKNIQRREQMYRSGPSSTILKPPNRNPMPAPFMEKDIWISPKHVTRNAVPQLFKMTGCESMGTSPALRLPWTPNGSRKPLGDLSVNMRPPPRPQIPKSTGLMLDIRGKKKKSLGSKPAAQKMESSSLVPPSTLAFLETHLDDFFPSPSQQIRELVEDIDDIPTNTQVAREIELDQPVVKAPPEVPSPLLQSQSIGTGDADLYMISSHGLEFSPRDLGEIFTGDKTKSPGFRRLTSTARDLGLVEILNPPPSPELPKTRTKPRFFEEKEEDLLIAALHESLLMAKQQVRSSSPRRSQRIAQNRKVDTACLKDDYDSDGFETDPDLLAVLDEVESRSLSSSRI